MLVQHRQSAISSLAFSLVMKVFQTSPTPVVSSLVFACGKILNAKISFFNAKKIEKLLTIEIIEISSGCKIALHSYLALLNLIDELSQIIYCPFA